MSPITFPKTPAQPARTVALSFLFVLALAACTGTPEVESPETARVEPPAPIEAQRGFVDEIEGDQNPVSQVPAVAEERADVAMIKNRPGPTVHRSNELRQRREMAAKMQAQQSAASVGMAAHDQDIQRFAPPPHRPVPYPSHPIAAGGFNREGYEHIAENRFKDPRLSPLSTFGLDVDTASYANMRRLLNSGRLPPADAIRVEELVNYFDYSPMPVNGQHPIALRTELATSPWNSAHQLAMIQVAALQPAAQRRPANRLVFLVDTSGSMNSADKLPLLKRAFRQLAEQLGPRDSVSVVTYAGSAGLALPATRGDNKSAIYHAIEHMRAGGSTAGARGIALAYQVARQQFDPEGNNRVILATDGDFNVGPSSDGELTRIIEQHRDQGIFLTVLGFGTGNLQDSKMHRIADHGDGNYYYIDTDLEARRVLVDKLQGTLLTVAKDVKLQVEFNPAQVASYRLIGYESRQLQAEDFRDDRKDAGELGSGHRVTALYEIVPTGASNGQVPALRYQPETETRRKRPAHKQELMQVRARYRAADATATGLANRGVEFSQIVYAQARDIQQASADLQWAASVAEFGLLLGQSQHAAQASYGAVLQRIEGLAHTASSPVRSEFVGLVRQAAVLAGAATVPVASYDNGYRHH